MKKNVLLTGRPGVGKTALLKKLIASLDGNVGGFYTEEIRSGGRRVGFKIRSFQDDIGFSGEEEVLAHMDSSSPFRVSRYGVNVEAFERVGVTAIERAIEESDLIVMDELGKMELFSESFQRTALRALDSPKSVLGVIQRAYTPFLERIRRREDVTVVAVTVENRDALFEKLRQSFSFYQPRNTRNTRKRPPILA